MGQKLQIIWILILGAFSNSVQAQFPSIPSRSSLPKPATELSGIDIYRMSIAQVIQHLGNPTRISSVPGTAERALKAYEWEGSSWSMRITSESDGFIRSMDVWGRQSDGEIGRTGEGLTLGSSVHDAQRIYGQRFCSELYLMGAWITCPGRKRNQWESPTMLPPRGYAGDLELDYDYDGIITHMKLRRATPDW